MMQRNQVRSLGWLSAGFATWLITCPDCGGGGVPPSDSSASEEASVHGKVMINGVPAKGGRICFDPTNVGRESAPVVSAQIGQDGSYTIETLVGENRVIVETPETRKDPNLSTPEPIVVQSGDNTHDVTLPHP